MKLIKKILRVPLLYIKKMMNRLKFRAKLILAFVIMITAVCFILTFLVIYVISGDMTRTACQGLHSMVMQNDRVIDSMLAQYEDVSTYMMANQRLYDFCLHFKGMTNSQIFSSSGIINPILGSYFNQDTLYSCQLYTPVYIFGSNANPVSPDALTASGLIGKAQAAGGAPVWAAGYDYGKTYGFDYLSGLKDYPYHYLITMVRQMNFSYVERSTYRSLPAGAEIPVLLVNIRESTLRNVYDKGISYIDNRYLIFNREGLIVSSNDKENPPARKAPAEFLGFSGKSGFSTGTFKGTTYLFCYDTIARVGWTSVTAIPLSAVIYQTTRHVEEVILLTAIALVLVAITLSAFLSMSITKPINRITADIRRFAHGDFNVRIPENGSGDFQQLAVTFNHMVGEIDDLIQENYRSAMREKEAHINMLTMQINPHFLYNTLNTLSMLSLENGDEKTSGLIIGLSEMLNYALKNQKDTASLGEEAAWLENYISIMQVRYEGMFTFSMKIPRELYGYEVPKLSMQPLIENAIVHGFADRESGGKIEVTAYELDQKLRIVIRDNGCSFDTRLLLESGHRHGSRPHIGIGNIVERIRLLYGDEYGVTVRSSPGEGTTAIIELPLKKFE